MKYLTYHWMDNDSQVIVDPKGEIVNECCDFVDGARVDNDCVLIHSFKGQSRACTVITFWLMKRYKWSLVKSIEYLNSRRPDLQIRPIFMRQLTDYENILIEKGLGPKTCKWNEVFEKTNDFENEELVIRNTYLNSQSGPLTDFSSAPNNSRKGKLKWIDLGPKKLPLSTIIGLENPPDLKMTQNFVCIIKDSSRNIKKPLKNCASDPVKIHKKLFELKDKLTRKYSVKDSKVDTKKSIMKINIDNNKKIENKQKKTITLIEKIVQGKIKKSEIHSIPDSVKEKPLDCSTKLVTLDLSGNKKANNKKKTDIILTQRELQDENSLSKKVSESIIKKVQPNKVNTSARPSSAAVRCDFIKLSKK